MGKRTSEKRRNKMLLKTGDIGEIGDMGESGRSGKGPLGVFWPGNGIFH